MEPASRKMFPNAASIPIVYGGFTCVSGQCVADIPPECEANRDCPFGYKCTQGECVFAYECLENRHCPDGQVCREGFCKEEDIFLCGEYGGECFSWTDNGMDCPSGWKLVDIDWSDATLCDNAQNCCIKIDECERCPELWAPVCGADGQTYANQCYAECPRHFASHTSGNAKDRSNVLRIAIATRTKSASPGGAFWKAKKPVTTTAEICYEGGPDGFMCPNGYEMMMADMELCDDGAFCCVPTDPCSNCPYLWDPVCGIDGQTYANECIAECQGIEIAYWGECEEPWYCTSDWDCADDMTCVNGVCVQETDPCSECTWLWEPVCGINGETYANECLAECQGVRIRVLGPVRRTLVLHQRFGLCRR